MISTRDAEEILKKEYHIDNFTYLVKEQFLPDYISDKHEIIFDNSVFGKVTQLGISTQCDIIVFEVILNDGVHNRRVAITQEMFRILRGLRINNALVAFSNSDKKNYRISLLTSKYEFEGDKLVKVVSNPRRYSYALGFGTKTKTAYKYLIEKGKVNSLDDLISRFSVEVVNKQFYSEIALCFTELVGGERDGKKFAKQLGLYGVTNQNKYAEFAVRLIGRVMFCWFLKEKKSEQNIPLVPDAMLSLPSVSGDSSYYHDVLEPLFFELLNTNQNRRRDKFGKEDIYKQIPYLNGGLFSPHTDDLYKYSATTQSGAYGIVNIPNSWFHHFFEVLSQYNFTVDENTSYDIELSIDPEMLGRIFENLLAEINPETGENAKKSTGSFYTPRDIVDYMVDSSLLEYLKEKTSIFEEKLKALISYGKEDDELAILDVKDKKSVINALYTITVLDPACGSGAFPIGMLQKVVYILQEIDPDANLWFDKATENVSILLKKEFEKKFSAGSLDYIRKLSVIQNSIFGIDIQPIAVEIARLRCFLSLVIEEKVDDKEENRGINPLPNLDFKIICANTLISLDNNAQMSLFENQAYIDKLKAVREEYFNSDSARRSELKLEFAEIQKKMYQDTIDNYKKVASSRYAELSRWSPFSNDSTGWFDPEWMFGVKDGFDVVIANPPYLDSENMVRNLLETRKIYSNIFKCAKGNWDIYVIFIEKGIKLAKNNGIVNYIIPNKLIAAPYALSIRKEMSEQSIVELRNFSNVKVFESVAVYPFVFILSKGKKDRMIKLTMMESYSSIVYCTLVNTTDLNNSENWDKYFYSNIKILPILEKLNSYEKMGVIATIKGSATVSEAYDLIKLINNFADENDYFKFVNTGTIDKYMHLWDKGKTQYIKHTFFKPIIKKTDLLNFFPKRYNDAISEKIIVAGMSKELECCYDDGSILSGKSTSIIIKSKYSLKFLLGILNSKLITFFYESYFSSLSLAGGFFRIGAPQLQQIPIAYEETIEKQIIRAIDNLLVDPFNLSLRNEIDKFVYELYGLSEEEIAIVEASK